ncbi:MAG TPA: hypothetical protein VF522_02230 [Ramlibacter sp.]|uniref:hypothetical protein n=1 Tax=Ramlibacter sp. TaxID=1917967 RepID=UPI002ED355E9
MPEIQREGRTETPTTMMAWGIPSSDPAESGVEAAAVWLTGGAGLLLWTALAFLLTTA